MLALPVVILFFGSLKISRAVDGVIWNRRDCDFVPIFSISSFLSAESERLKATRELEFHNFRGSRVKVTFYQEPNLVSFFDNDTKITGIFGDVWTILAGYLNFTLIAVKSEDRTFGNEVENGTFNGLVGSLQRDEANVIARSGLFSSRLSILEYTMPLWSVRYHVYIKPEWKYDEYWILHMLSTRAWCSYFLLLLALSVLGYVYEKRSAAWSKRSSISFDLQDHVFYTVGLASAQGYVPGAFHKNSKIIYICTSVFCWLFLIAFNSNAIFLMTNKKYDLPFTDLKSMIRKSDYGIVAFEGSQVHRAFDETIRSYFRFARDSVRVQYVSSTFEVYKKVCSSERRKLSAFEAEDRHKAFAKSICKLVPIQTSYFPTRIASAVRCGFKYKRSFDTGILKISETGILDGLKNRWLNWQLEEKYTAPFQSIDMDQVNFIFIVLLAGYCLSLLLLLVENVTFRCNTWNIACSVKIDKIRMVKSRFMKNKE